MINLNIIDLIVAFVLLFTFVFIFYEEFIYKNYKKMDKQNEKE